MDSNRHKYQPPKIGEKILKLIYDDELVDDILGDLDEMYQDRVEEKGLFKARLHYFKDAFLSIQNYNLRRKRKVTQNNAILWSKTM